MITVTISQKLKSTYHFPDDCPTGSVDEIGEWLEKSFPEKFEKEGIEGWLQWMEYGDEEVAESEPSLE